MRAYGLSRDPGGQGLWQWSTAKTLRLNSAYGLPVYLSNMTFFLPVARAHETGHCSSRLLKARGRKSSSGEGIALRERLWTVHGGRSMQNIFAHWELWIGIALQDMTGIFLLTLRMI